MLRDFNGNRKHNFFYLFILFILQFMITTENSALALHLSLTISSPSFLSPSVLGDSAPDPRVLQTAGVIREADS